MAGASALLTKIRRSFAARLLIFLLDLLALMPFLLCFSLCLLRDYLRWRWQSFVEKRKSLRKGGKERWWACLLKGGGYTAKSCSFFLQGPHSSPPLTYKGASVAVGMDAPAQFEENNKKNSAGSTAIGDSEDLSQQESRRETDVHERALLGARLPGSPAIDHGHRVRRSGR
jgi:hypothetical protein